MQQRPLPERLPRFAQRFRLYVDSGGMRMITGEWQDRASWLRAREDWAPLLMRAGFVGVIAQTLPALAVNAKQYYGDESHPVIAWHYDHDRQELKLVTSDAHVAEFCYRLGVSRELFETPL